MLFIVAMYLLFLATFLTGFTDEGRLGAVADAVISTYSSVTLPSDLIGRPAAWHALYLGGFALTLMAAAVLLSGGARLRTAQATVAAAVALTLVGVVGQSRDVPEDITEARVASVTPEQLHTCVERDATTYCAFPEWAPRTDDWARAVDDVRALAGGDAQDRPLAVRQRVEARYGLDTDTILAPLTRPGEVTVGTTWGGNRVPEFTIAVAGVLVTGSEASMGELCDGRMVTVMWLALAARPTRSPTCAGCASTTATPARRSSSSRRSRSA
ncbi:hypothetical protein SALBM217S_07310 [Streptomyces griseoloalbus]